MLALPAAAQDLTNAGATITVQAGATLYVGSGLNNQAASSLSNAGTLRVDGPLTNAGTLDLTTGMLEVRGDLTNTGTLIPGTSTVTVSGPANQLLTPGGATLHQLVVNKPTAGANTVYLTGDLTVSQLLTMSNGLLNTRASGTVYTLRLPDGATLSGEAAGRYVVGALEITRNGLSGPAVNFGHGVTLNPQGNNLGTVTITRTAGLQTADVSYGRNVGNTTKGIDQLWTVNPTAQPAADKPVLLLLSWLPDNDNGLSDFSQARAWQQAAAATPWVTSSASANATSRSVSTTTTTLNRFTVSNAANPLPVTLTDFTARAEGAAAVRLNWATASEFNNVGFTVERSLDARDFQAVTTLPGAGTSTTPRTYTLLDAPLPAGATLLYYRLRQTDLDGTLAYSPVRAVTLAAQAAGFVVYPTRVAAGQGATYLYTGPAEPATLHVLDLVGRVVRTVPVDGRPQGEVPVTGLPKGTYLLRYTSASAHFSRHCVID